MIEARADRSIITSRCWYPILISPPEFRQIRGLGSLGRSRMEQRWDCVDRSLSANLFVSSSAHPIPVHQTSPSLTGLPLAWSRWMESSSCSSSPHASTNGSLAEPSAASLMAQRESNPNVESSALIPPYWHRHQRGDSLISVDSNRLSNPFIRLVDNTIPGEASEQSKGLWAKTAQIDEHVVIRGSAPGIGDYVVWTCKVETLNVSASICEDVLLLIAFSGQLEGA